MTFPTDQLPRRYRIDENGWRVLVGLTVEETFEFETLEDIPPWMRQSGHVPWQDGVPITSSEKRWLELYQKHEEAWKALMAAATVSRRSPNAPHDRAPRRDRTYQTSRRTLAESLEVGVTHTKALIDWTPGYYGPLN